MIRVRQIKININDYNYDKLKDKIVSKLKIKKDEIIELNIIKRSIDARDKPIIYYSFIVRLSYRLAAF